jgi:hypothetical protein
MENDNLDLVAVDFSDLEQIEESIAPIFLVPAVGGKCDGGPGSGCICMVGT